MPAEVVAPVGAVGLPTGSWLPRLWSVAPVAADERVGGMGTVRDRRDVDLPLRRGRRYYSTDLRFMAARTRRSLGRVVLYECYGVDHAERRTWVPRYRSHRWAAVLDHLARRRQRQPLLDLTEPSTIDVRRGVVRDAEPATEDR